MQLNPWKIGVQSARANLVPGIVLQIVAVLLIVSYHFVPAVHDALGVVAGWQARFGVAFSGVGYLFFCGILPPFICLFVPSLRPKEPVKAFAFAIIFWSVMGLAIAQFYLLQAVLFGNGSDLATLVKKVLVDQFVFSPFLSVPIVSIVHAWKDRGYRWSSLRPVLGKGWYSRLALPTLIMNWAVWFPSLFVIYSMPTPLQPHIAGLVSGFWSLMCLQIAARTKQEAA